MPGTALVGDVLLPDLPPGTPVAFDTETFGLHPDGEPGGDTGDPGSPPAWVSAASIAWRDPATNEVRSHAWGFDQGPCPGKPGRVRRPREGGGVEDLDVEKFLAGLAKAGYGPGKTYRVLNAKGVPTGKELMVPWTWQDCYEAIGLDHWVRLLRWLQARDVLVMHNAKFDMWIAATGPRDELVRQELRAPDLSPDDPARREPWWGLPGDRSDDPARRELWWGLSDADRDRIVEAQSTGAPLGRVLSLDLDYLADGSLRPVSGIRDTMLTQAFFEPMQSVALKKTGKRLFRIDADAAQQDLLNAMKKQGVGLTKRYDLTPWSIMEPYAADDAELTLLLDEYQQRAIEVGDVPPECDAQIAKDAELMRVLYRMERRGLEYDVVGSRQGAADLQTRMRELEQGLPFNPNKLAEAKRFYFAPEADGGLHLMPLKITDKTGAPCLDEAQLRLFVQAGQPHAAAYDEWSHCKSAVGKWYRGWADRTGPDGRLRTVFKQCAIQEERAGARGGGAISGRLAVGRVQLQAIPHNHQLPDPVRDRPVRSLIRARPGYALYEMDLPQGEVRIATVIVDCQAMWDVIDTGQDLHGENAKRIFGVDEEHPKFKEYRGVAKRIVFGTLYGAGVRTLRAQILESTGMDYSENETRAAKEAFEEAFPEFPRVARQIQRKADRNLGGPGYVRLIDGRRRWFGPDEFSHKAFNAVIQGSLAQTGKTWMIEVERQLPGIQVLAIHDSDVVEVPDTEEGYAMALRVAEIGKEVYERDYGVRGRKMSFDILPERWDKKG